MAASISLNIVQNSQNAAANKSNVTVNIIIKWDYGSYNLTNPPGTITIDGVPYNFNASYNANRTSSGSQTLYSKTVDVSHDNEGKKTLACSATYDTEGISGVVTASATKVLTQIARASTIGATDANIGATSLIAVGKKASSYTHSIAYKFGELSGYVTADGGVSASEVKFSGTSVAFTVPTSFYAQIPNAKSGTVTLTCRTYSGAALVGTEICTFAATAAQAACTPTVSGTVVDSNSATKALTGDESKLVRYMSTALCTISAAARNSASLTGKKINNVSVDTSRSIANVETNSFNFYAVDSRGYATSLIMEAEMIPYVKLTCNAAATRDAPTTGEATLTVKGNYFNGSFGAENNTLTVKYRIGGGAYENVTPAISGNTYSVSVPLTGMDYQQSFDIDVVVSDKLDAVSKTVVLKMGIPGFHWNNDYFQFHIPMVASAGILGAFAGFCGIDGSAGYVKIATIRIGRTYANAPIVIEIAQRDVSMSSVLYMKWLNIDSADPSLDSFLYTGAACDARLYRSDVSIWDLYIKKNVSYDNIGILRFHIPPYMASTEIQWTDIHSYSVPDGAIVAVAAT